MTSSNQNDPRPMSHHGVAALSEVPPNRGSGGRTTENILHIGGRFEHDSVKPQQEPLWNSDLVNYEGKHEEGNEATASGLDGLTLVEMFEFTLPKDSESRRSKASVRTDLTTATICYDGGSSYEGAYVAGYENGKNENSKNVDSLKPSPFQPGKKGAVATIFDKLADAKILSAYQDQGRSYIPCIKFHSIMTEEAVSCVLQELNSSHNRQSLLNEGQLADLIARIAPPVSDLSDENVSGRQFKRVLASLILTRKADCIFDFVDHGLDDRKLCEAEFSLPDQDVMLEDEGYLQDLYKGYPGPCQDPEVWSREDIRNLRRVRWEVSPVFFTIERGDAPESTSVRYKIVHYELRSAEETLPFGKTDIVPKTNGAFSSFEFYTINPHQQNFHRYTKKGKDHPVAIKKLEDKRNLEARDLFKMFKNERYILDRLTLRNQSPHVVKLLATFEVVGKSAPSKYHFMFEAADGTILTLWESEKEWKRIKSRSQTGRIEVARWVARQCHGLAEGLSQFHKFSKFHDDPNPKTKGMHGDIKPDNILWYKGWIPGNSGPLSVQATDSPETSDEDDLGVLQLADFGLSSFHSTGTVHNVISSNDFLDYAAPETEGWLRHPPPADVWQLGCLFLDFVTWLVTGPTGYKKFKGKRLSRGLLLKSRARFSTFKENKGTVLISRPSQEAKPMEETTMHVNVSAKVLKHASNLYNSKHSSSFVRDVINLVINRMLVVEPFDCLNQHQYPEKTKATCRISSSVASEILGGMLDMGNRSENYFQPSSVEKSVEYSKEPIVIKTTLKQMRQDVLDRSRENTENLESEAHPLCEK